MEDNKFDFSVDLEKIKSVGALHPHSIDALQAFSRNGLSSEDRLYYQLVSNMSLETMAFRPGSPLCEYGQAVSSAYIIREGEIELRTEGKVYRVGPGTVLGLASGLANQPHNMTATALTVVSASVIPIYKALKAVTSCNPGLRGINRNTVMRTLNLSSVPESLK